ncbi:hypothetical protein [Anaerosporobacter faecicola]|uniref:hypothetical protein n=1 Tax=Anaerosporobacter faecicola TaxID=2718714 RepID=UPI001439C68A|nr:hypothetical protein [Anaerosporobacter faecicola]
MLEWNDTYVNILLCYSDKMVHINCDETLMNYLALPGNGAVELAKYIKESYKREKGVELAITVDSLAIEILAHAYLDQFADTIEKLNNKISKKKKNEVVRVMEKIKDRTEIIDCGERSVDNNRFVWDLLKPLAPVIYLMLGKHA